MEPKKPTPSAAEIEDAEKQRRKELREYRKNKQTVWYLR